MLSDDFQSERKALSTIAFIVQTHFTHKAAIFLGGQHIKTHHAIMYYQAEAVVAKLVDISIIKTHYPRNRLSIWPK